MRRRTCSFVPTAALTDKQKGGKPQVTVKVADESGTLVERPVKVGVRNRVLAEIQSGLEEGDRVVVTAVTGNGAAGGERGRRPSMRFF